MAAVCLMLATGCGAESPKQSTGSVITSTTKIADAGVLGNQRRPDESCAPQPAAPDPGPPTRPVRHAAGETEVPAEPQRIVVLSGDQLDALCALGLQSRIVAAALPDGSSSQPSYLGTVIHDLHGVGSRSNPDLSAIRAAGPDLILGSQALTPEAVFVAVGDRPDRLHRRARCWVAGQPAAGRSGDGARRRGQQARR